VPEPIHYYMDQHIPAAVTNALVRHGVNVLTAQDAQRCGLPDAEQLAFATAQQRVLVTFDPDYLALHQSGISHAGIAWCPAHKYSIGQLIQALLLVHGVLDRDSMCRHVEYL
jgi:predicted nuclease of predicted toxin-antitoxin system